MSSSAPALSRVIGVPGAVLLGLGSIVGTGIFVSIGVAAGAAGASVVLATALAAVLALFNGLSSAQLAAVHPVSGGTYEYGYRWLRPSLGFTAGWMFLCAKSASAATAALGTAGYLQTALGREGKLERSVIALGSVLLLTALVAGGLRRSSFVNAIIVGFTLLALATFILAGAPAAAASGTDFAPRDAPGLLHATALMFVAYTGYGRVATLGEEIREPSRNIPRAIVFTLLASALLYVAVTWVAIGVLDAAGLAAATRASAAPLEVAAARLDVWGLPALLGAAAITAMLGVLLNLLLGLSRVLLAMARRGDMPGALARVERADASPRRAVLVTGTVIAALVCIGDVKTTWSFSAFTVLVYYALTNLAALRLSPAERRFPRAVPGLGLLGCLGLAFFVQPEVWTAGLGVIAIGLAWHFVASRRRS